MVKVFSSFSRDFVSPLFPKKGEEVKLSVVFSEEVSKVILKCNTDYGLIFNYEMKKDGKFNNEVKYSVNVKTIQSDEVFRYFFAFFLNDVSYYYSKKGITRYTPKIEDRFSLIPSISSPSWVGESTCYQIFPDRFFNGEPSVGAKDNEYSFDGGNVSVHEWNTTPPRWEEGRCVDFYNGDLKGIENKLEYLSSLGINVLYINPIFSSESVHRYDTIDFNQIDNKLGGNEALVSLTEKAHKMGFKIILDISINHTGLNAVWLKKAQNNPSSKERSYYYFDEYNNPVCWQNVKTLPQLNYGSEELRKEMYKNDDSILKKYVNPPYNIDGWRLDVAPEVGRNKKEQMCKDIWREVRKELKNLKEDIYLVGEDWDDSKEYLEGDMWDGTMNYYGCGRILRSWMGQRDRFLTFPWSHEREAEEKWNAYDVAAALNDEINSTYDQMAFFQMNLIDSHDTARLHNDENIMDFKLYSGCIISLYLLPGMPNLYYGDEVGLDGWTDSNEGARFPMEWREEKQNKDMFTLYQKIGLIRKKYNYGYFSTYISALDEKCFQISRFSDGVAITGIINRGEKRSISLNLFSFPKKGAEIIYGKGKIKLLKDKIKLSLEENESLILLLTK